MSDNAATELDQLAEQFTSEASAVQTAEELEALCLRWAGKKQGRLRALLGRMKDIAAADRRDYGQAVNRLKQQVQERLGELRDHLTSARSGPPPIDVSLPGRIPRLGALHPVTRTARLIEEIFAELGYSVAEGPEVEDDYHNFEALNFPPDHPARDMQDTFWLTNGMLMRTHTSANQVRVLERFGAPVRAIFPGRCFRYEAIDASHENTFYQLEGLLVDRGISVANLIAVMKALLGAVFGREVKVRLRPGFFPFVEPGFELDSQCLLCEGAGCATCKGTGWIELIPCGLVHPRVLEFGRVDTTVYSGFAFGLGLTRLAMLKFGIPDIRLFNSGDIRFCEQFPAVV